MSIQSEITRIANDKDKIRTKLVALNLATATDDLDTLADAVDGIVDKGTPAAQIVEGETYTIVPGYYRGGSVQAVGGGGSYTLQSKTVTPTTSPQTIQPDTGYYGLNQVLVNAIPSNYKDISGTTATAADVFSNKLFVSSTGVLTAGTMANNGAVSATIDGLTTTSYSIPVGYHNGSGVISLDSSIEEALQEI